MSSFFSPGYDQFNNASVGLKGTDLSGFGTYIPDSLKFTSIKQGLAARRVPIKIRSEQQTYASNNNKLMRVLMPNATLYDTRNGYFTFNLQLAKTGGTYIRTASGITSIFNRIRILAGSTELEDIRDYNRIQTILWEAINPIETTTNIGVSIMGYGTQLTRNMLGAAATDYAMTLNMAFFTTELLPLDNISSQIIIELYIEDPTTCIETDGTNPIITITNLVFHVERLELDQAYRKYIRDYISVEGLTIGFHTWERYINQLSGGANQNINIQHRSSSLNAILNIFVNNSTINNPAVNDKFLTWPGASTNLQSNQVIVNNMPYPDEPVDFSYAGMFEGYQAYCRWVMKWKLNGYLQIPPSIAFLDFNNDRFIQIDDFEAYPEVDDIINPFSTINITAQILKKMNFNGSIPANTELDSWVQYFRQIQVLPNGATKILQ